MTKILLSTVALLAAVGCSSSDPTTDLGAMGDMAVASTCAAPTGAGTMHGSSVSADETWTAAGSPHLLPYDTSITATLTIEPCATVRIGVQKTITVSGAGKIIAHGTATQPIDIDAAVAGNNWASIRSIGGGTLSMSYTRIAGGGDRLNTIIDLAAALDIRADQDQPPADVFFADHVTVEGSLSNGVYIHESGGFAAGSTDVVIKGSAGYPIHSWSSLLGTIPPGTYTGNTTDQILITATGGPEAIAGWDVTMHDRGVPYHVGTSGTAGTLYVGSASKPLSTLTIEPGVVMLFKKNGVLYIEESSGTNPAKGALVAVGTAAKPIVFGSAEPTPAAGDWYGIGFGQVPAPTTKMDNTVVEFAGATSVSGSDSCAYPGTTINDAAIRIHGGEAATVFITNTTIKDSATNGIDRGFRSDTKPSFLPTNHFMNIGRCTETYPRDISGACPTPVPCPM